MRNLRDAYSSALIELGYKNENIVVLDADLALSTKTKRFGTVFPDRFFDMGISEANMMGVAAGLATCNKIVFASTFAVFATGRCYDQIRQSIAYPCLNVKIVATHAGISVGGDGASHQMLEDIALMRVLPNMRVLAPADATEMEDVIPVIASMQGPFYVRIGRADAPIIFERHRKFRIGKAYVLRKGSDVTIIATGTMTAEALKAYDLLKKNGIEARIIHMPTIKPIDKNAVRKAAKETGAIITAEEHTIIGGLGDAVSMAMDEPVPMIRIGVSDVFGESGGARELMEKYGLTAENIAKQAKKLVKARK
ncbi:MAG: transketolase family protein [Thermoplasmata archaeon]|nr:MAG: transketolase family protein [Thermoplasmata archaeon]KAA0008652.1 MAG: transketolase family protein [Thermoplasmata archaeon]MCD6572601.1 transketolase family protein [Thermoplasmata archaeon]